MRRAILAVLTTIVLATGASGAPANAGQIKAQIPDNLGLDWDKGIQPINQDNYYKAIECGKQGGDSPVCLFYEAGLCKNDDFELALYTPYKYVAYEVWNAVRAKQPPPQPNYQQAQRTRVTLGITPTKGSKNAIISAAVKRGGKTIAPTSKSLDGAKGSFTFDFPAWAATSDISIEMVGKTGTKTCLIPRALLQRFR
jgi:hypothetical protein